MAAAAACGLTDGTVYHYWFEVTDAAPWRNGQRIRISDPTAYTIDWQLQAQRPADSHYNDNDAYPASVIKFKGGQLVACDIDETELTPQPVPPASQLSPNNQLVIYELPTAWTRGNAATADLIVVLANFSDYYTPNPTNPAAQYIVNNWPATPPGGSWREVTQGRAVPLDWIGKEPIYPWEAKVYQLTW